MIWLVGMASSLLTGYAIFCVGCETTTLTIICRIVLLLAANVMLWFANDHYEKLKSRIKALEKQVENNAEHIHKLVKNQSGKTIEYTMD